LAKDLEGDKTGFTMLMPARSLDQGFAMTGSFSCMSLATLLIFDTLDDEKKAQIVKAIAKHG
jgi:tagatose-6-phosphate ketose/aldose isomerase